MEYFQFQQMQYRLPQNAYATNIYNAQNAQNARFQQVRGGPEYPFQGHRWMDPYARNSLLQSHRTETKPRLSKGEVEQLEAEFQKNNKPSSNVKKGLAEQMRVDVARINNWFQNRRAKKKQELKAQMQDAKNKAEEDQAEVPTTSDSEEPLPSTEQPDELGHSNLAIKTEMSSPSPLSDNNIPSAHTSPQQEQNLPEPQPNAVYSNQTSPDGINIPFDHNAVAGSYFPTQCPDFSGMVAATCPTPTVAIPAPMPCTIGDATDAIGAFSYPYMTFSNGTDEPASFEAPPEVKQNMSNLYQETNHSQSPTMEAGFQELASDQMEQPDFRIKSPPAIDLAGRRKRPGLALSGLRSISNGPATGMDFGGRRVDPSSPMRRVASATGFGPHGIRRFPAPQRGQFSDRRQESLLQAARSPNVMPSPLNAMAPPTPNTPIVATQQSLREATVSSNSSSEENVPYLAYPDVAAHPFVLDQSLRTPPATPITVGDAFAQSIETTLGFAPPDDALLTPSIEYPMRANEYCLPNYVSDNYMSQPSTPGFPPQVPISAAYYASMPGGNTEYNWSDATMVSKSSPHQGQRRQLQFNNFTAQDFSGTK
ncbi:hypothetical protein jhhlp_007163 [Lomentospora prolificans]|uniref:Homeobox domain-containing protein n=1 Tax=Lomentospora prolificans TaxID=41688 RepID=A0A2N3N1V7_9PEZI|nr:hypothetical protein jhhlp_007163 [Lomentospora prolificans]